MKKKTAALLLSLMALVLVAAGSLAIWSVWCDERTIKVRHNQHGFDLY